MRYAITALVALIIIIFGVVVFTGGGDDDTAINNTSPEEIANMTDFVGTDAVVRLTIDGRINAEEDHRTIRFTIDRNGRAIDIIQGYSGHVIKSSTLPNTQSAYDSFVFALAQAEFADDRESNPDKVDGLCPNGRKYRYEVIQGNESKVDLWSTSCSAKTGTFAGERSLVESLFKAQIPDYSKFVQGVRL